MDEISLHMLRMFCAKSRAKAQRDEAVIKVAALHTTCDHVTRMY